MNTYQVDQYFAAKADGVVISLRRAGFGAWIDSDGLHTDATRAQIALIAGHGLFLKGEKQ